MQKWVANQLAGPVVGHVAAPVGPDHLGTDLLRRRQQVGRIRAHPEGVDGVVLQQQQVVLGGTGIGGMGVDPVLEGQGVAVADLPQPPDPERAGVPVVHAPLAQRDAQSDSSSESFNARRKAAA